MRALSPDVLTEVIASIWRSSADPELWQRTLQLIKTIAPHTVGSVIYTPFAQGPGAIWQTIDAPPGFIDEYVAHWQGRDVSIHAIARRMPSPRCLYSLTDLIPDPKSSIYWQTLYASRGIHDTTGLVVNGMTCNSAEAGLIGLFDAEEHPELAAKRAQILGAIADHFEGAIALHWRLVNAERKAEISRSTMDRVALGVLMLSESGKSVWANSVGRRLLDQSQSVQLVQGRIQAIDSAADQHLEKALRAVATGSAERPILLPKRSGGAITAIAAPPYAASHFAASEKVAAVLFLSDPSDIAAVAGARLAALYNLSPAESRIAQAIAEGYDSEAIARKRGASVGTVRTQIKSIMAKIGASRQSDIVRAVLATAVLGAPDATGQAGHM